MKPERASHVVPATREDVEAVGFNRTMFASLFLSVSHSLVVCVCYFSLSLFLSLTLLLAVSWLT